MRRIFLATGLCAVMLAAASQPGLAFDRTAQLRSDVALELSGAKKKKQQRVYVHRAPQSGHMRHPWMDPSFGPDGRPYPNPYPPNVCSVDEGYGRFSPCDFRD